MRTKLISIFIAFASVLLFLAAIKHDSFAQTQTPQYLISGSVFKDSQNQGVHIPSNGIAGGSMVVTGKGFERKIELTDPSGNYSIVIPKPGTYSVKPEFSANTSASIAPKTVLVNNTYPHSTVNFIVPTQPASITVQDAGYPDCSNPVGCNTVDRLCGDDGRSIVNICFDADNNDQLCTTSSSSCGFTLVCSNGSCVCPSGLQWDPNTGQCVEENTNNCDPNTCNGCNAAQCETISSCQWNGYSCQEVPNCGGAIGAACCPGSDSCEVGNIDNLVCATLGGTRSCQLCGGIGQFCCSGARCDSGGSCQNYVCRADAGQYCTNNNQCASNKCNSDSQTCINDCPSNATWNGSRCVQNITYSISGQVFQDENQNDVKDGNEQGIAITILINGVFVQTDTNGQYSRNVTQQGAYTVSLPSANLPTGSFLTTPETVNVNISNSSPTATVNFGVASNNRKISGTVFEDTNANGSKETAEQGKSGVTVLVNGVHVLSGSNGGYEAKPVQFGTFTVGLNVPQGFRLTSPAQNPTSVNLTQSSPTATVNFGLATTASSSATPVVSFTKPATNNLTVSGTIEVQAVASVSGSTFTSFKICSDVANDCINADSAAVLNRSNITVNVPGGADTTGLSNGNHTLTATAVAANGKTGTGTRIIKVQNAAQSITPGQLTPGQTATPVKTATPVWTSTPIVTNPAQTNTPIPNNSITPVQSATPTPGTCNNNNFCDFGENINSCPAECQIRCGDNICSTPQENPFSCEADCGDPGTSATPTPTGTTGATNTSTPTRNPSHTATPTIPPGSSNTPTRNPSHTATPTVTIGQTGTPTPTLSPAPQDIVLNVSVKLPGIGNKSGDITNPINKTITAAVAVYNSSNQYVKQATGNLTFDGQVFKGSVNMGALPTGSYTAYIKTNNSLIKRLNPTITGGTGGSITIPQVELVTGDFDQTNKLDIVDYNKLLTCYGKNQQGNILNIFGTSAFACGLQDLNDDGKIDEKDVNIFLRGFAIREGDKP